MDIDLIIRRTRPADGNRGCECWLIGVYPPDESTPVLAITNHPKWLGGDVTYDGITYTAYNCAAEPAGNDADGSLPEATIRISNVLRALIPTLEANDYFRGYTVELIPYNDSETATDYSTDVQELVWINHKTEKNDLLVTMGVPQAICDKVPADTYGGYSCRHRFRLSAGVYGQRCGYTPLPIIEIQNPSGLPVVVRMVGCLPMDGHVIEISGTGGLTPTLNGVYTCTADPGDVWNVTLDGTDGDDYTGVWDAAGVGGFYSCERFRPACRLRGRIESFGNVMGQRTDSLRVAS